MSDGSGRVMRTDLADLGITVVEEINELLLSVPIQSCEWGYLVLLRVLWACWGDYFLSGKR